MALVLLTSLESFGTFRSMELKIAGYQVSEVETGQFALDGGAMFGIVPKPVWERTNPADEENRIDMRLRSMLIQKPATSSEPARNILVDSGIGTKWAEKYIGMYKIDHSKWSLVEGLKSKGLALEDITDVILTHLHFDHAGGMTVRERENDPSAELLPVFPNAKVWVQKRNWDLAMNPTPKDKASYLKENYAIYGDSGRMGRALELVDTSGVEPTGVEKFAGPNSIEEEILPGIFVQVSHGHTLGMQTVRVGQGKESIVYCADLIPTATHVRLPFIMGYDCYPMFILEEKKRILDRAIDEGSMLFYEHCPRMVASRVGLDERGNFFAKS